MREGLFWLGMMIVIVLFTSSAVVVVFLAQKASCARTAEVMSVEWQYSMLTECMIRVDDRWVPLRNYRIL